MSLLEPWYLLGLLGLALPWLLHRFSHHEPPEQVFPSTQFLEPTRPPATSQRKLRYWLLMALRMLLLALLCLLFAQPWLRSFNDANSSEAVQLIVVDNSFSMRAPERWRQAEDELGRVLNELPESDAVQLFSYSGQLSALTDITNNRASLSGALAQTEPDFESADFGELMRRLDKVAGDIDQPVSATFITDAQRSNLPAQVNTLFASQLQQFTVVSVEAETPVNYYLRAEAITNDTVKARVSVTASAAEAEQDAEQASASVQKRIQISMNDRVLASQDVVLAPGERQTIQFDDVTLPSDNEALMLVSFEQRDFLPDDDQVSIPVRGLSTTDIMLTGIDGAIDEQARVFLSTALETDTDARIEVRDASSAMSPSVRHTVAFVDEPSQLPEALVEFVSNGGNALVLPRSVSAADQGTYSDQPINVSTIDLPHELALGDINWFDTQFYSIRDVELNDNDRVLLGLGSGQPLLIEREVSDLGRLLILNDNLDGFNSNLPLQPAFVQLMQHIMQYFNASNALPVELKVGRDLFLPASTQLLNPEGDAMLGLDQLGSVNHVRIVEPGVYTVLGANSTDNVTVVLDAVESNLSGLTRVELDAWEARHDVNASDAESEEGNAAEAESSLTERLNSQVQDTQTLWRWLLPALLLFVLVESLLANRMLWVRRDGL